MGENFDRNLYIDNLWERENALGLKEIEETMATLRKCINSNPDIEEDKKDGIDFESLSIEEKRRLQYEAEMELMKPSIQMY